MCEDKISYQCWICPKCYDDHSRPKPQEDQFKNCKREDLKYGIRARDKKIEKLKAENKELRDAGVAAYQAAKKICEKELDRLEGENDKLKKCVKYYANKSSWKASGHVPGRSQYIYADDLEPLDYIDGCLVGEYGGKLARQTLEKLGG